MTEIHGIQLPRLAVASGTAALPAVIAYITHEMISSDA
jgi:hypothetical protein